MVMYGGGQDQNNGGQNGQSSNQGSQQLGSGGHTMSDLQCSDPSGGGGTTTAFNSDLDAFINTLDASTDYCVDSDGSAVATGKGNWSLVNGKCGNDNSAIWLQSYVSGVIRILSAEPNAIGQNPGQWCLKGDVIANFARTIVLGCQSNGIIGSMDRLQWMVVSNGLKLASPLPAIFTVKHSVVNSPKSEHRP